MLTLQTIKADPEFVVRRLAVKGFGGKAVITEILEIDAERRRLQQRNVIPMLRSLRNLPPLSAHI